MMHICRGCISELKSRGEKLLVGDMVMSMEEAEANDYECEWCNEYDDLYVVAQLMEVKR